MLLPGPGIGWMPSPFFPTMDAVFGEDGFDGIRKRNMLNWLLNDANDLAFIRPLPSALRLP